MNFRKEKKKVSVMVMVFGLVCMRKRGLLLIKWLVLEGFVIVFISFFEFEMKEKNYVIKLGGLMGVGKCCFMGDGKLGRIMGRSR